MTRKTAEILRKAKALIDTPESFSDDFVTRSEAAFSALQNGEMSCETDLVIASPAPVAKASAVAISPAISMDSGVIVRETDSFIKMQAERDAARVNIAKVRASHAELLEALKESVNEFDGLPHSLGYYLTHKPRYLQIITNAEAIK